MIILWRNVYFVLRICWHTARPITGSLISGAIGRVILQYCGVSIFSLPHLEILIGKLRGWFATIYSLF
jgi:hypothetical protein